MFGTNKIRGAEYSDRIQVQDIFYTIQGEGPYTGQPALFIRLTGCNLRCWFCDTKWDDDNDLWQDPLQVAVAAVLKMPKHCHLVVITGGEPMRQQLTPLINAITDLRGGVVFQIETAGTLWQELPGSAQIVVSPKTPKVHPRIAEHAVAFKYVIRDVDLDTDGLPFTNTQDATGKKARLARPPKGVPVYLSPCDEYDEHRNKANLQAVVKSAMAHGYIASSQLHKTLGVA